MIHSHARAYWTRFRFRKQPFCGNVLRSSLWMEYLLLQIGIFPNKIELCSGKTRHVTSLNMLFSSSLFHTTSVVSFILQPNKPRLSPLRLCSRCWESWSAASSFGSWWKGKRGRFPKQVSALFGFHTSAHASPVKLEQLGRVGHFWHAPTIKVELCYRTFEVWNQGHM